MPTISVDKAALYQALGREYTTEEFDELCFDYGIELDEDTTDQERPVVDGVQEPPQLKIEIPANRYDLLCFEGISLMLNIFNGRAKPPQYKLVEPPDGKLQTLTIAKETAQVRPYAAGAILRGVEFTQARYESFIALQDKLHQNLARQRVLVAIGTHDLDTIQGPFTYDALPPGDFSFVPLNQTKEMTGTEMMHFYEKDRHLGRYLHIIKDAPVYPLIRDANKVICSMPPIINGEHSKITLKTRNVFIDTTATDRTKLGIVLDMMCTMFAMYTEKPFTVEPIKVISEHNGESRIVPDLSYRTMPASISYLNACCGLDLSADEICRLLQRMAYLADPDSSEKDRINVKIPPTRADVLHQADIMEDFAIAYGFNDLPRAFPKVAGTVAQPLKINKLSDIIRTEAGMAGWSEAMPLILCSHEENFDFLNHKDDGNTAIKLANPKTVEYQVVRTSLIPGLLKTLRENKSHSLPLKIFEVSDVAFKDDSRERKTRNERHFAAAWIGKTSGFEVVHGLMDRVMLMLKSTFITKENGVEAPEKGYASYWIEELEDPMFFAGHAANVLVRIGDQTHKVGNFGILHPTVLEKFELKYPVSTLEVNIEPFL